jgi:hypothetical protein
LTLWFLWCVFTCVEESECAVGAGACGATETTAVVTAERCNDDDDGDECSGGDRSGGSGVAAGGGAFVAVVSLSLMLD